MKNRFQIELTENEIKTLHLCLDKAIIDMSGLAAVGAASYDRVKTLRLIQQKVANARIMEREKSNLPEEQKDKEENNMETKGYWGGYNEDENFRILLYAKSEKDAAFLAKEYAVDACLEGTFEISYYGEPKNIPHFFFDCDYVIEDTSEKDDVRYVDDVLKDYLSDLEK